MSLKALKDWGGDITIMLGNAIVDQLQNASLITLKLTRKGIAQSMHRTLTSPMVKVRGTIPTEKQIINAVKKYDSFIVKECKKIVPSYPANVSGSLTTGLYIVLWTGSGKGLAMTAGGKKLKTFRDVENYVITELKEVFFLVLRKHFGPAGSNKSYESSSSKRLNVDTLQTNRVSGITAGKDSWRQEFSLSHKPGSTRGQQGAVSLKEQTAQKGRDAQDEADFALPGKGDFLQSKADFYTFMEKRLANFLTPALRSRISSVNKPVTLGDGTQIKVQGLTHLEVEFDDRSFQAAENAGFDKPKFKAELNKILAKEAERLRTKLGNSREFSDEWWRLSGSPSRKEVWESATTEQVMRTLTRGKHVKIKKKTKLKKPKQGKGTAKKSTKAKARVTTRKRPNKSWGKTPVTKSGRPDMRYKANKQAFGRGANSPIALMSLLQKALPIELRKEMTGAYPKGLEWRTGRLGTSARIQNILPIGNMTTIQYTYQRNPYEVFEPGSGSPLASATRDPQALIGGTIREIAQSIMGTKFGLIRTKRV